MAELGVAAVIAIGVSVGSVVVPAAAYGVSVLIIRSRMKTKEQEITVQNLQPGDHISYKHNFTHTRQYAIVIKIIQGSTVSLMHMTGKKGLGRINYEDVDLTPYSKYLTRLEYDPVICFDKNRAATRAKAFSVEADHNPPEHHAAIHDYWKFFNNDEHFAIWCHTGINFSTVARGLLTSDYTYSEVKSLSCLRKGDHVCYKVGKVTHEHGIVIDLDMTDMSITVVKFNKRGADSCPTEEERGVEELMRKGQLYRYDYDIAVGSDEHTVVQRARNEVGNIRTEQVYKSDETFAVWCKTLTDNSSSDLSTLAKARVAGHVRTIVQTVTMLQPGEHIAFNSGKIYYYQHAIVVKTVDENELEVIYLPGNVDKVDNLSIRRESLGNVGEYIRKGQLFKYFYDIKEWEDRSAVIESAKSKVGELVRDLPFKDPYHFAFWCKTGVYQAHLPNADAKMTKMLTLASCRIIASL